LIHSPDGWLAPLLRAHLPRSGPPLCTPPLWWEHGAGSVRPRGVILICP
jgi:hypothetical protein